MKRTLSFPSRATTTVLESNVVDRTPLVTQSESRGPFEGVSNKKEEREEEFKSLSDVDRTVRLKALLEIYRKIPLADVASTQTLVTLLRDRLKQESDTHIKGTVIKVLAQLACEPYTDVSKIIGDLLLQISEASQTSAPQILQGLQSIASAKQHDWTSAGQIIIGLLSQKSPSIRALGLNFLAQSCTLSSKKLQNLFGEFTQDSDPRVRVAALKAFERLYQRGAVLDCHTLYQYGVVSLTDDIMDVRLEGIKFLWVMANIYPDVLISVNRSQPVRLVDYAFQKICSCVTDVHVKVRTMACRLLGSLQCVDGNLLLQTLSKKILTGAVEDETELDLATIESDRTGRTNPEKMEIMELEDSDLISSAAAGAFVHGLEDEFMDVRCATIDSICEVSLRSDRFADQAVAPLVDMFNDEIDIVRINAMNSLRKMGRHAQFDEEQLQIVLSGLEDSDQTSRLAVHKLLRTTQLPNTACLIATLHALLHNLKRNGVDTDSIFVTCKCLGQNHAELAAFVAEDLLHLDSRFLPREANLEDINYIAIMIMLFNAAPKNPNILPLLPAYTKTHYHFMRDKYPPFTPRLDHFSIKIQDFPRDWIANKMKESYVELDTSSIFSKLISQLGSMVSLLNNKRPPNIPNILHHLKSCKVDFLRVATLDKALEHKSLFYLFYLKSLKLIVKAQSLSPSHMSYVGLTRTLLQCTYRMENLFLGFTNSTQLTLYLLRTYAHAMYILHMEALLFAPVRGFSGFSDFSGFSGFSGRSSLGRCVVGDGGVDAKSFFVMRLEIIKDFCIRYEVEIPKELIALLPPASPTPQTKPPSTSTSTSTSTSKPTPPSSSTIVFNRELVDNIDFSKLVLQFPVLMIPSPEDMIKKSYCVITEPVPNFHLPHLFLSFLSLVIPIKATLYNAPNTAGFMIKVLFPDSSVVLYPIASISFKPLQPLMYAINTEITIEQSQPWNEKCAISISIVKAFKPDVPEFDCVLAQLPPKGNKLNRMDLDCVGFCEPLQYFIFPKATKD